MFGEPIPRPTLDACFAEVQRCDVMLLVGTSGTVNPAAQFPLMARELGAKVIEVNPGPTQLTHAAHLAINGPAGELLPQIVEAVHRKLEVPG
jgi:NAD-dependent deacetylase